MKHVNPILVTLIALALSAGACSPSPRASLAQSRLQRDTSPEVPLTDVQAFASDNNAFGLDLYATVREEPGNLVLSPYSISTALAMTYAGARGETESEMGAALHYRLAQPELHRAFNQLDLSLAQAAEGGSTGEQPLELRTANSVWIEKTLGLLEEYLDIIAVNYGAGIHLADFMTAYEPARREINAWVRDMTEKRIDQLIPEGALNSSTQMVLVNAIYFKADWLYQFSANDTSAGSFHLLDGTEVQAQMMKDDLSAVAYATLPGLQVVELPYQGGRAVMDIIVPDEGNFEAFEAAFDQTAYQELLGALEPTALHLELPKFTFDARFDLQDALTSLGMPLAFDPEQADFSGMTGGRDLYISKVLHQAFVAVDEKGTEAAAATAVIMEPTSAILPGASVVVDRPFIFVIRDLETQQILFLGRVLNPTE